MFNFCKKSIRNFKLLSNAQQNNPSSAQFLVGKKNGFLPRQLPLVILPNKFSEMDKLLYDMPIKKYDESNGLLYHGTFGTTLLKNLPTYNVSQIQDSRLLSALYRDYTFLASAYLLEPCDLKYRKDGNYGFGRDHLPSNIAIPLCNIAKKINAKPFMEYALSYALYNYKLTDIKKGYTYDNLHLIRSFHGTESERGFIIVHVQMVAYTNRLVSEALNILASSKNKNRRSFNLALFNFECILNDINNMMDTMWNRSYTADYIKFRTFIMGTKNQPMFPNGVIYEGVSNEPTFYRGESGANDSIIPTCDNLFELTALMPVNPLTDILKDFRTYRPVHHSEWLTYIDTEARNNHIREFAMQDIKSSFLYLTNIDRIREFRHRHWNFTKEYVLKHTSHPVATGGSPIITWLPNQLSSILKVMKETVNNIDSMIAKGFKLTKTEHELYIVIKNRTIIQHRILIKDVEQLNIHHY